jgi:two-component system, NtrC family, nitrogen regulation response regulator GlnG
MRGTAVYGTSSSPLLHRLEGYRIYLPPLRERREDIGALFVHFLRGALEATGELDRLEPREAKDRPWLLAQDFGRIALASFPGNLRRLLAVARRVVISSRGQPFAKLDTEFEELLAGAELPVETPPETTRRPRRLTDAQIKEALTRNNYNVAAAALDLGVNRNTLYLRDRANPGIIRTAETVSDDEILQANDRHRGNMTKMAADLQVSPKPLKKRLDDVLRRKR